MHKHELPRELRERIEKRRGRAHAFDPVDPARCALLVVDMQNYFCEPGQACEIPLAREIVPNINRLARATRESGATVIWILMTQSPAEMKSWSVFYDHLNTPGYAKNEMERLSEGDHGNALWHAMEPARGDLTVRKKRFSAFIQGSSDLDAILKARGIDTVVITGTTTQTCCQTTALDAMMLDYKVIFVSDGTATRTDEAHLAVLANVLNVFGDVRSTDEVVGLLQAGAKSRAAAE
jgi:ureidoacrylate peracid hydrolase